MHFGPIPEKRELPSYVKKQSAEELALKMLRQRDALDAEHKKELADAQKQADRLAEKLALLVHKKRFTENDPFILSLRQLLKNEGILLITHVGEEVTETLEDEADIVEWLPPGEDPADRVADALEPEIHWQGRLLHRAKLSCRQGAEEAEDAEPAEKTAPGESVSPAEESAEIIPDAENPVAETAASDVAEDTVETAAESVAEAPAAAEPAAESVAETPAAAETAAEAPAAAEPAAESAAEAPAAAEPAAEAKAAAETPEETLKEEALPEETAPAEDAAPVEDPAFAAEEPAETFPRDNAAEDHSSGEPAETFSQGDTAEEFLSDEPAETFFQGDAASEENDSEEDFYQEYSVPVTDSSAEVFSQRKPSPREEKDTEPKGFIARFRSWLSGEP